MPTVSVAIQVIQALAPLISHVAERIHRGDDALSVVSSFPLPDIAKAEIAFNLRKAAASVKRG